MLKYVVQYFGFVHYSGVSSGGEPFIRDWKRLCALVWLSAGVTNSFFGSDTAARPVLNAERVRETAKNCVVFDGMRCGVSVCYAHSFETPEVA